MQTHKVPPRTRFLLDMLELSRTGKHRPDQQAWDRCIGTRPGSHGAFYCSDLYPDGLWVGSPVFRGTSEDLKNRVAGSALYSVTEDRLPEDALAGSHSAEDETCGTFVCLCLHRMQRDPQNNEGTGFHTTPRFHSV